jgi:phenylalanyl-tRNA synthetase beta chain
VIFTKNWLNEWIELSDIFDEVIAKTLNRIGLEVDSVVPFSAPKGVVVGKVETTKPHPNAEKLQICQINIGTETLQIVTNDKKVSEGDFVPVATVGTVLPTFKIKKGKLRGEESFGMLCSTEEFGIPRVGEGVVILDDSIGELVEGKALSEFSIFNDTLFEIELTANRGDCLSLHGIARDLATAFNRELKKDFGKLSEENGEFGGIDYNLAYYDFEEVSEIPLFIRTRLAIIGKLVEDDFKNLSRYVLNSTGVLLKSVKDSEKISLVDEVLHFGDSKIGISSKEGEFFEFSYIDPEKISVDVFEKKLKTDELYYNSSRGSEPDIFIGVEFLESLNLVKNFKATKSFKNMTPKREISLNFLEINDLIGTPVPALKIEQILKSLGFEVELQADSLKLSVPKFRHDIKNRGDVVEEILRIIGIDEIPARKMEFTESRRDNETSQKLQLKEQIRNSAIANGFYETLLYTFGEKKILEKYGFSEFEESLLNPIVESMDTLRPTLVIGLLQAIQRNINFGKSRVALFEIGRTVAKDRSEKEMLAFVFSGNIESDSFSNAGKPAEIDFTSFSKMVLSSIGGGEISQSEAETKLEHPYQIAKVSKNGAEIGKIYKLHNTIQAEFDIPTTYIAEIELDKLELVKDVANEYSKFGGVNRDLSLVVGKDLEFRPVRDSINSLQNPLITDFYPLDIFQLDDEKVSLTIRFQLQSMEKTLEENEITDFTNSVIEKLSNDFGAYLR